MGETGEVKGSGVSGPFECPLPLGPAFDVAHSVGGCQPCGTGPRCVASSSSGEQRRWMSRSSKASRGSSRRLWRSKLGTLVPDRAEAGRPLEVIITDAGSSDPTATSSSSISPASGAIASNILLDLSGADNEI